MSKISNIVVGATQELSINNPLRYQIPLDLSNVIDSIEITVTIANNVFNVYFNLNPIDNNIYMSCYTINKSTYYFGGFKCVFGNYINKQDNGCPYLFYFLDESNGEGYASNNLPIDYKSLSNGVKLYAELR